MALILGIESTCDETAASVVRDGTDVLSNVIATQFDLHAKFRGVVPEIASRAHIENILPVLQESLEVAGCTWADIDAIAIANRPGLVGSLLIGVTSAKTLAWSLGKPLISVDHVQAHLYSVMLKLLGPTENAPGQTTISAPFNPSSKQPGDTTAVQFPAIGMVVSGGHTAIYRVRSWSDISLVGSTIDDAVGEAYDKVAAILNLGYPGGPILDRLAKDGNPRAVHFPRSLLDPESLDFSFSGLKTSVLYHVRGQKGRELDASRLTPQDLRDIAASFQAACVDVIRKKLLRAIYRFGAKSVIVGGGVSANCGLRQMLQSLDVPTHVPELAFCTDNAAMSAGLAHVKYVNRDFASLDLDAITFSELARTS